MRIHFNHFRGNIHPIYQHLLGFPPEGAEFVNAKDFETEYQKTAVARTGGGIGPKIKTLISSIAKKLPIPNVTMKSFDAAEVTFSCGSIPLRGKFVLDIECYEAVNRFDPEISENAINKAIVFSLLNSDRCIAITCHSESAAASLRSYQGNRLDHKIHVVSPSIEPSDVRPDEKDGYFFDILFVGRYFKRKGGHIVLRAAEKLCESNPEIRFTFVSQNEGIDIQSLPGNIRFLPLLPREEVLELFRKSHAYVMPTFFDTFGYVFLESFAHKAVPISLDDFAIPEIIENDADGFVIQGYESRYFDARTRKKIGALDEVDALQATHTKKETERIAEELSKKIAELSKDRIKWWDMAEKGFEKIQSGKFSRKVRNDILSKALGL